MPTCFREEVYCRNRSLSARAKTGAESSLLSFVSLLRTVTASYQFPAKENASKEFSPEAFLFLNTINDDGGELRVRWAA